MTDPNVIALLTRIAAASEAALSELQKINIRLDAAQSQPAAAPVANDNGSYGYRDFTCATIVLSYNDKGQPTYKAQGAPFAKYGVVIWPEVLPILGIDPAALQPGPNPHAANLRAEMKENGRPRKVIGLATPRAPTAAHDGHSELPF
jgi:hypothetical protein